MKLWKKTALAVVIIFLAASGICGAVVMQRTADYNLSKTIENYSQEVKATAYALAKEISGSSVFEYGETVRNSFMNYIVKKYGADDYMLLHHNQVACNLTDYELADAADKRWDSSEVVYRIQHSGRQYILIAGKKLPLDSKEDYRLILVRDISDVYQSIREQASLFLQIYLGAAVLAAFFIFLIMQRMLKPLRELQRAALNISAGELKSRAVIRTKDEVGTLGRIFNQMADRIEAQVEELENTAEQRKLLLGSLTHELKTPMTSIIGYADTLLHVKISEARKEKALRHIYQESMRLERLSGKMVSLIGMYDNDTIEMQEQEVLQLIARVAQLEKHQMQKHGMKLETKCAVDTMRMDMDLMESLLMNLIDNAVKASQEGDIILLEADQGAITVTDKGKGMPKEELSKVTQAFYMIDKSRSRQAGGAGLGLALCVQIARLHGAELKIISEPGKGTAVSMVFAKRLHSGEDFLQSGEVE